MDDFTLSPEEKLLILQHRKQEYAAALAKIDALLANATRTELVTAPVTKTEETKTEAAPAPKAKAAPRTKAVTKTAAKKTAKAADKATAEKQNGHKKVAKETTEKKEKSEPSPKSLNGIVLATLRSSKEPIDAEGLQKAAEGRGWTTKSTDKINMIRVAVGTLKQQGFVVSATPGNYQAVGVH